jgi:hypothetical protein
VVRGSDSRVIDKVVESAKTLTNLGKKLDDTVFLGDVAFTVQVGIVAEV